MTDSALNQLGVDLDQAYTSAGEINDRGLEQGVEVKTRNGAAILARAVGALNQYRLVGVAPTSAGASASVDAVMVSTGNLGGRILAVALTSISSGEYGWVHTACFKEGRLQAATAAQPNVPLYTTGTGGTVDDATISAGQLMNIYLLTSAASASAPAAIWDHPVAKIDEV